MVRDFGTCVIGVVAVIIASDQGVVTANASFVTRKRKSARAMLVPAREDVRSRPPPIVNVAEEQLRKFTTAEHVPPSSSTVPPSIRKPRSFKVIVPLC